MAPPVIVLLLVEICQCLIKPEKIFKFFRQKLHGTCKLPTVIIDLYHLLDAFDLQHIPIAQPFGGKDLIRRTFCPYHTEFSGSLSHF